MRAVCLALTILLLAPAAQAADPSFIERLAARGPQDLRVAEDFGAVIPGASARVSVEEGVLIIEIRPGDGVPPRVFRYDGKGFDRDKVWSGDYPAFDLAGFCDGGGTGDVYEIKCFTRSDLTSRALRPPSNTWWLRLSDDGLRVVQGSARQSRVVLTPIHPARKGPAWLAPGLPANLGDALTQLAAHEGGWLGGGSSGGGDWYASDLAVSQVSGLDFKLERTAWPDRGGRSDQVPATWSFDYQGPDQKDAAVLTWLMVRKRKGQKDAEFWCVGSHAGWQVTIACHRGGKPSSVRGEPDVSFRLAPFPRWTIYVETGADNPFSSVGTSRLEPQPFP